MTTILKTALLALATAFCTTTMADDYAYLTVNRVGGEASFALSEISKITFDSTDMIVELSDGTTQRLPLSELNKMYFSANGLSAIATATAQQQAIRLEGGVVHVHAQRGSAITLYNIGGRVVQQLTADGDDTRLNVSGLARGVYIVKVGDVTKKIMNK